MSRLLPVIALALVLTCAPTAVPRPDGGSPSTSPAPIATSDLITLREGGQQSALVALVVRKVATAEAVRTMPDGLLLADGLTVLALEPGGASTVVKKIDRRTGQSIASRSVDGVWQLYRGFPAFSGASGDGTQVVLFGSSYNFTDESGKWTARTTFGVLDVATFGVRPVQLDGRYGLHGVSNDGRFVYVDEFTPVQLPSDSRLRAYDMTNRKLEDVSGETQSVASVYSKSYVGEFAFELVSATETIRPSPDMIQVAPVTRLVRLDMSSRSLRILRLPVLRALTGEEPFAWSLVTSRDRKTLYVVNPMAGLISEVDVASLELRRSAQLTDTKSERGLVEAAVAYLHPVADAKMGFGTGAVLSLDGATLYVLAAQGIWSIDLASLKSKLLTRTGSYETVAMSPDGARLYVLSREDGFVSAVDARTGQILGSMTRIAFASDIVAVDAG